MDGNERIYQAYRADRDAGVSHREIVAAGLYGEEVEAFCLRYDMAVAAYSEAMIRVDQTRRLEGDERSQQFSTGGEPLPNGAGRCGK